MVMETGSQTRRTFVTGLRAAGYISQAARFMIALECNSNAPKPGSRGQASTAKEDTQQHRHAQKQTRTEERREPTYVENGRHDIGPTFVENRLRVDK